MYKPHLLLVEKTCMYAIFCLCISPSCCSLLSLNHLFPLDDYFFLDFTLKLICEGKLQRENDVFSKNLNKPEHLVQFKSYIAESKSN